MYMEKPTATPYVHQGAPEIYIAEEGSTVSVNSGCDFIVTAVA